MHADRHARRQHERLVVRDSSVTQKLLALGWEFLLSGAIWKRGVGYLTRYRLRKITHNDLAVPTASTAHSVDDK